MTIHTITAFFDDRAHADEAVALLRRTGVSDTDVTLSPADARDEFATFDPLDRAGMPQRKGFWGMLEELFGGSDDHERYAEGVRRGTTMLTAHVEDDRLDQAVEILDRHGSIDLDEREVSWRNDGWLGGSVGMPAGASILPGMGDRGMPAMNDVMPVPVEPAPLITPASFAVSSPVEAPVTFPVDASAASGEAVGTTVSTAGSASVEGRDGVMLQVVEERLVVGKRAVSRGKVRVHSYVVERPVSESIQLRDETIRVDRRAIDREVTGDELGVAGFQDRSIEMEEVDEEAVVSKTARVVEEIGLRKDVSNRVETIRETLRSTKVDIDDGRDPMVEHASEVPMQPLKPSGAADGPPLKTV